MKMEKASFGVCLVLMICTFILGLILGLSTEKSTPTLELEVYTQNNIYYIEGLTVTNEVSADTLTFKDMKSLNVFISDVTSGVLEYHY